MAAFDAVVAGWQGRLPDVPEILYLPQRIRLMHEASQLLIVLKSNPVGCEKDAAGNSRFDV